LGSGRRQGMIRLCQGVDKLLTICVAGRDQSSGIEKAGALHTVGLVDERPDGPEDDEIERHRQGKREQPQPPGDAQAIEGGLTGQPGGILREQAGTRIRRILHDARLMGPRRFCITDSRLEAPSLCAPKGAA
jgi:hypothetical protein